MKCVSSELLRSWGGGAGLLMATASLQSPTWPHDTAICVSPYGQFTLGISWYCGEFLVSSSYVGWELKQVCDKCWKSHLPHSQDPLLECPWGSLEWGQAQSLIWTNSQFGETEPKCLEGRVFSQNMSLYSVLLLCHGFTIEVSATHILQVLKTLNGKLWENQVASFK